MLRKEDADDGDDDDDDINNDDVDDDREKFKGKLIEGLGEKLIPKE